MKFHVEAKERLLCWQCFQTTSHGMHYKSDSSVERSQPQKRNKNSQKHLLSAPATAWILGKEGPLQNHRIAYCYHRIQHMCGPLLQHLCGFQPQPGPGCPMTVIYRPPALGSLPSSSAVSNSVCAMAHFAVWLSLWSLLRITVFNM